jgi:hypothetical protein
MQALRSMRSVLRTGGILVFDQGQTDAGMRNPQRFCPVINKPDLTRLLVTDYAGEIATMHVVSGDKDMAPAIEIAKKDGIHVVVMSYKKAMASELVTLANSVSYID